MIGVVLYAGEFEKSDHRPNRDENGIEEHPSRAALHHLGQKEDSERESDQHKLVVERVDKVVSDQAKRSESERSRLLWKGP